MSLEIVALEPLKYALKDSNYPKRFNSFDQLATIFMQDYKDFKIEEHVLDRLEELGNELDSFYGEALKVLKTTSEHFKKNRFEMLKKLEKNLNSDPNYQYLDVPDKKSVKFRGSKRIKSTPVPVHIRLAAEFRKYEVDETWKSYFAENQTEVLQKGTPPDIEELRWLAPINAEIWMKMKDDYPILYEMFKIVGYAFQSNSCQERDFCYYCKLVDDDKKQSFTNENVEKLVLSKSYTIF